MSIIIIGPRRNLTDDSIPNYLASEAKDINFDKVKFALITSSENVDVIPDTIVIKVKYNADLAAIVDIIML